MSHSFESSPASYFLFCWVHSSSAAALALTDKYGGRHGNIQANRAASRHRDKVPRHYSVTITQPCNPCAKDPDGLKSIECKVTRETSTWY